jgi:hypothetical protein
VSGWVRTIDRLPTEEDACPLGRVEICNDGINPFLCGWRQVRVVDHAWWRRLRLGPKAETRESILENEERHL